MLLQSRYTWQSSRILILLAIVNPRRACAARVTVLVLCICMSACWSVCPFICDYSRTTGYEAAYERYQPLQRNTSMKIIWGFCRNDCVREIWRENKQKKSICILNTSLPRLRSARSAHLELIRGYVSKSSAALNLLMITQLSGYISVNPFTSCVTDRYQHKQCIIMETETEKTLKVCMY